ncbi:MAG TPA: RNA polymerase sigma factor [Polyangiales bacterium]|nr:RNA polymerase sigma factor [Polyangiales bacterium]
MPGVATTRVDRVRSALAGRREQLVALVRRHVGESVDADEVVQVAAQRALSRAEQLRDADRVEGWLARIAKNAAIDELRGRRAGLVPIESHEPAEPAADRDGVDCACVLAQAARLRPAYAEILKRVDLEGVAVSDAARELGLSANNAMVRLHRARKALRGRMAEHCGTTSAGACSDCGCEERGCCPAP